MLKTKSLKVALLAAPAFMFVAPVSAQPAQPPVVVTPAMPEMPATPVDPNAIRGSIPEPQSARTDHRVPMEAGRRYAITVTSDAFDPYLRILRPGTTEVIAEDDDSGGGTNPRLVFTPTVSGEYVVQVSSFAPGGFGDYALSVEPQAPLPAIVRTGGRTERSQWTVYTGALAASDPADRGRRFDDYELRLEAGQTAMIHVQATGETDTMLQVLSADRSAAPIIENDDGGGGTNPFILFAPDEAGTYVVRVIGFDENATGGYRLRIGK